jgi:HEAT repeat protein
MQTPPLCPQCHAPLAAEAEPCPRCAVAAVEPPWWVATPDAAAVGVPARPSQTPWWADPPVSEDNLPLAAPAAVAQVKTCSPWRLACLAGGIVCFLGLTGGLLALCFSASDSQEQLAQVEEPAVAPAAAQGKPLAAKPKAAVLPPKDAPPLKPAAALTPDAKAKAPAAPEAPALKAETLTEPPVQFVSVVEWPPLPLDAKTERLLKSLDAPSKAERLAAMKELGNLGTPGRVAIPILIDRLRRTDKEHADQAEQAARSLAQIGPPAVPELIRTLDDPSPAVRGRALWALGIMGPDAKEALGQASQFLQDSDPQMRALAAQVMAEMGSVARPALPLLVKCLRDPVAQVRLRAAEALHEIGMDTVIHLLALLTDDNRAFRLTAVQALLAFHESADAVEALVAALRDPDVEVRAAVAGSLTRLGPAGRAALPGLLDCLKEDNLELQTQAYSAVMAIVLPGDANFLNALGALNAEGKWAEPPPSKKAAPSKKEWVKFLIRNLDDPNATRRLAAVLALGQMAPSEAKEASSRLVLSLGDPASRTVQAAAALALPAVNPGFSSGAKKAGKIITELIKDLKSAKKQDAEELIQLHMLTSMLSTSGLNPDAGGEDTAKATKEAYEFAAKALDELPYSTWALPAFVRGVSITAEFKLGFVEPFSRLSIKLRTLIKESKDLQPLGFAFSHLGEGMPTGSPFQDAIHRGRYQVFTNAIFLDWLILAKLQGKKALDQSDLLRMPTATRPCHYGANMWTDRRDKLLENLQLMRGKADFELQFLLATRMQQSQTDAEGLFRMFANNSDTLLAAQLQSPDTNVRWAAALLVGSRHLHEERELVRLLSDSAVEVRETAHNSLVRLARGTDFGPFPLDAKAKVEQAKLRWLSWLDAQEKDQPSYSTSANRPSSTDFDCSQGGGKNKQKM